MTDKTPYEKLKDRFEKIIDLSNAAAILGMDAQTAMPENSADDRTRQLVAIASIKYDLITSPDVEQWLDEAEKEKNTLPKEDQRNLVLMRRWWVSQAALPAELAAELARLESEGERLHTAQRKGGDWSKMKDWYEHSFNIMRAIGEARKQKLGAKSVYEALLAGFSPDISPDDIARELGALEKNLPALIQEALKHQAQKPAAIPLTGPFPKEQQEELCKRLGAALGFDFTRGRIDMIDRHPMSSGSSSDVRFTTDYKVDNFLEAAYSTIHETGHSIYAQQSPIEWRYQLAGEPMGMAIHESQSRIFEVQACHTPEFFRFLEKEAREVFNRPDDPALAAENLERLINKVTPSFIRIEADELTYPAHVILRHKLETAILDGKLDLKDLPAAWNKGMQELLGITPPGNAQGCMQDVHWPVGYVGYFPAYTLGDMGAAQLFAAACKAKPEIKPEIEKGNFTPLREWLRDNVHGKGSLLTTDELFIAATGEKLNAQHYLNHLSQRYTGKPWKAPQAAANNTAPKVK